MSNEWYIAEKGRTRGPFDGSAMVGAGLTADTQVWSDGMVDWRPVREVPELVALLPAAGAQREQPTAELAPTPQPERPEIEPVQSVEPVACPRAEITLIPCPCCGELSDSIKNYRMASFVLFLVYAAAWRTRRTIGCPRCVREDLVKATLMTAIPSTLLFPLVLAWHGTLFGMTWSNGHSKSIRAALR